MNAWVAGAGVAEKIHSSLLEGIVPSDTAFRTTVGWSQYDVRLRSQSTVMETVRAIDIQIWTTFGDSVASLRYFVERKD
jgi:hypothetical protein